MKIILTLLSFSISYGIWSQTLAEANNWFENYEYSKSAEVYSEYAKTNSLPLEDYKRLTYAYYITGKYEKCLPLSDSILKTDDIEPLFYFMNAESAMAINDYEKAKASYVMYQSLDDEHNVEMKIASCDHIPNHKPVEFVSNKLFEGNSAKADFVGEDFKKGMIVYHETGKDSLGEYMQGGDLSGSELLLIRPFYINDKNERSQFLFPDSIQNISVPSITINENTDKVYFTVMRPVAETEVDVAPHLYEGDLDVSTLTVSNMKLWKYSGYEDTSSCAHATLNSSGDILVFAKMGATTKGADLYYSQLTNGNWSTPSPFTSLNTNMDEIYPLFIGDTLLSFASDGRVGYGGLDIYTVKLNGISTLEIDHFTQPINSFNDDFNFIYYSIDSARYSSNRTGGTGDDDIYFVKFNEPVEDVIEIDSSDFVDFVAGWKDQIIYFDFDKFDLKKDTKIIDELISFLKSYPSSKIVITGHADSRGTVEYNLNLGLNRANKVKDELISLGISENQIITETKGKSDSQVDCSEGCSEEQHAENRVAILQLQAK